MAAGADANLVCREFQNFRCAVGVATAQRRPTVVAALLAAGGEAQWPEEETDIPAEDLTGEPDTNYGGLAVDPLAIAFDQLGWILAEANTLDPKQARADIAASREIIRLLMEAGASLRCDPATGCAPVDRFMMTLVENPTHHASWTAQAVAECFFETMQRLNPGNAQKMLNGQWRAMEACRWEWDEDLPDVVEHLTTLAQQAALQTQTKPATAVRTKRL